MESNEKNVKPFLRWVGGKKWLIPTLLSLVEGLEYEDYYEPFLGGGSVFLSMDPKENIYLSDLNEDLINTYTMIQRHPEEVISKLREYKNEEKFYYKIRKSRSTDELLRAVRFIYLNKTSFNGVYRVNKSGEYNVPYGYRTTYNIEEDNIRNVSRALQNVNLDHGDFYYYCNQIKKNDLIFLDPPYTVSHNENGFIKYNQKLFSLEDQYRLKKFIDIIDRKGAYYILTNAAHEQILEIFEDNNTVKYELFRSSLIGGKNATRGKVKEYLFTNIEKG